MFEYSEGLSVSAYLRLEAMKFALEAVNAGLSNGATLIEMAEEFLDFLEGGEADA